MDGAVNTQVRLHRKIEDAAGKRRHSFQQPAQINTHP
jgi:hypothetical protein